MIGDGNVASSNEGEHTAVHHSALICAFFAAAIGEAWADDVIPSDRVTSVLIVREGPSRQTTPIDELSPGERLPFVDEVPRWNRARLPDAWNFPLNP